MIFIVLVRKMSVDVLDKSLSLAKTSARREFLNAVLLMGHSSYELQVESCAIPPTVYITTAKN